MWKMLFQKPGLWYLYITIWSVKLVTFQNKWMGWWEEITIYRKTFYSRQIGSNNSNKTAKQIRKILADYFVSDAGEVTNWLPGNWFAVAKWVKNTCEKKDILQDSDVCLYSKHHSFTGVLRHFVNAYELPGFSIGGK